MTQTWDPGQEGVLEFPSGRLIRGRGLIRPLPAGPRPDFGLYLLGKAPTPFGWDSRWVRWRDLHLPADDADALDALTEAWRRAEAERVEVACWGGRGRTGTALACLAVLDGVPPAEAVAFVRAYYRRGAVETPWQRKYVARFRSPGALRANPPRRANPNMTRQIPGAPGIPLAPGTSRLEDANWPRRLLVRHLPRAGQDRLRAVPPPKK